MPSPPTVGVTPMSSTRLDQVRSDAMTLSERERAELAHDLVQSLDVPDDADAADAWDQEVVRRIEQLDAGTARLIDREEFRRRMEATLSAR